MRWSEWLAVGFFVWLSGTAWVRGLSAGRRGRLIGASLAMCALVVAVAQSVPAPLRDWAPPLYVLVGYFLSGWLFVAPSPVFERWLAAWDQRILGKSIAQFGRWPRWLLGYLDLVYVFCFMVLPAGFAVLVAAGHSALADRFWTMVLASEFGAFAPLAIVQARPPWALEPPTSACNLRSRRFASSFVRHATIRANTFPSGHVAASLAVAFTVMSAVPWAGALFLALAISISTACIVGRYHYVVDVAAGAALAGLVWAIVML